MRTNIFGTSVFTQLPDGVLYTNMPDKCKQLYALLCKKSKLKKNDNYDIEPFSHNDLAKELKCSKKSIQRHINKLISYGLIEAVKKPGLYTEYVILDVLESSLAKVSENPKLFKSYLKSPEKSITEPEKEKEEPIKLSSDQNELKQYIESKIKDKLTIRKVLILCDTAAENPDIADDTEIIKMIVDTVIAYRNKSKTKITNIFGYIKKAVRNYEKGKPVIQIQDNQYAEMATSLSMKLAEEYDQPYHLSVNQCIALFSIVDQKIIKTGKSRLSIFNFLISEVINKSKLSANKITDMFRYLISIINNYGNPKPDYKTPVLRKEQSYDINEFAKFAITFSGNVNGTGIPEGFDSKEQSYDIDEFEKLAVTFSKNVKNPVLSEEKNKTDEPSYAELAALLSPSNRGRCGHNCPHPTI